MKCSLAVAWRLTGGGAGMWLSDPILASRARGKEPIKREEAGEPKGSPGELGKHPGPFSFRFF